MNYEKKIFKIIKYLRTKNKVLILSTSNRWGDEKPKSLFLAEKIFKELDNAKIIDISRLKIYKCEGNVSSSKGNICGVKGACLKDKNKNPSGLHCCWASINNKDDELWKVTKELFESDCVLFFSSVRWGQTNSIYQKLLERLTFIENKATTLKGENILEDKEAGLILLGHNWNGHNVLKNQRNALNYFGFKTPKKLFLNWQYTDNSYDESAEGYKKAIEKFKGDFGIK